MALKELKQIGDMEPSCPVCGNANAMLHEWHCHGENTCEGLRCRDCGYEIENGSYIIKIVEPKKLY